MLFHPKRLVRKILSVFVNIIDSLYLTDVRVIKKVFYEQLGYPCNLRSPKTFNEIINWYKLHDNNLLYSSLIDKYQVKEIVSSVIGEEFVIPTILGKLSSPYDIPWDSLPDSFVIKCNHDSGSTIVCYDKSLLDKKKVCAQLSEALSKGPWQSPTRARICRKITPSILIEKNIAVDLKGELLDYKFFCFQGKVKIFKVDMGRAKGNHRANYYSVDLSRISMEEEAFPSDWEHSHPLPEKISEMISIVERLAAFVNRKFIRVDLYDVNGRIFFGELTFYPAGGYGKFNPEWWDYELGNWINKN
ncbi:MAG: hypothetical protein J6Y84_01790 [Bacteroidaceae bacterium]|nr:hypothetical protein [Bacteroidaceae bacterium]